MSRSKKKKKFRKKEKRNIASNLSVPLTQKMTSNKRCNKKIFSRIAGFSKEGDTVVRSKEGKRKEGKKGTKKETVTRITEYGIPVRRNDRLRCIPLRHLMKSSDSSRKSRPSREIWIIAKVGEGEPRSLEKLANTTNRLKITRMNCSRVKMIKR